MEKKPLNNKDRYIALEAICDLLRSEKYTLFAKKMPTIEEDPTGEQFSKFSSLIQCMLMWPTTYPSEKCNISEAIIEYNEGFNFNISGVEDYYQTYCLSENSIEENIDNDSEENKEIP